MESKLISEEDFNGAVTGSGAEYFLRWFVVVNRADPVPSRDRDSTSICPVPFRISITYSWIF